jgi:hypothetical protein
MDSGARGGRISAFDRGYPKAPVELTIPDHTPGATATYSGDMAEEQTGVDLSGIHSAIDRLKVQLCRCQNQGTCIACRGFEVVRQQVQVVAAAASQPVLMQVAQEVAMKDLMTQLGGLQEKLAEDPQLQELMSRIVERVQDDLGGPENLNRMLGSLFGGAGGPEAGDLPPDDRPPDRRPGPPEAGSV